MTKKARRKLAGALKAQIALEAIHGDMTMMDVTQCHEVHPNQIYAWKKQLQEQGGVCL